MKRIDRFVTAIKWFGIALGVSGSISAIFMFNSEGSEELFALKVFYFYMFFLIGYLPLWTLGWIINGDKSIIPYPLSSWDLGTIDLIKWVVLPTLAGSIMILIYYS